LGGSFHPRLDIGETPIVKKYREGKMKRTSRGVLKLPETVEREAIGDLVARFRLPHFVWLVLFRKSAGSRSVAGCSLVLGLAQVEFNSAQIWARNAAVAKVFKRPVLKHGPRSLTYVQVLRW
jgi:hypothetical protein